MAEERFPALMTALTESRVNELREAKNLVTASNMLKAQQAVWMSANEGLNAAQKSLDDYVRDTSMRAAKETIKNEDQLSHD